jgi:hypothetical protein
VSAKRLLFIAVSIILLAAGIAMAVAGGPAKTSATGLAAYSGSAGQASMADTSTSTTAQTSTGAALDPAKQEPVLDQFVSKDPFDITTLTGATSTPTSTPTATPTSTPTATPTSTPTASPTQTPTNPTSAAVVVSGHSYTVKVGNKVPSSSPVFTISALTSAGVTFKLLNNMHFEDGSTSVQVAEHQQVSVTNADTGTTYTLKVTQLNFGGTTAGTGGGTTVQPAQGHVIQLLSINTRNGVSSATFKVDGTTFADKQVGAIFTSDWGQIKVLAIDAAAQTVTFMHGDATFTLHVGQQIEK